MKNKLCGIYIIKCIVKGTIKGLYVGQSNNIQKRKNYHFHHLRKNTHVNKPLQNSFNKYGESSFELEPIEFCSEDKLTQREQYWFNHYAKLHKVYNTGKTVDAPMRGRTISNEVKEKIRKSLHGRKYTEETLKKMSQSSTGKTRPHKNETKKKITQSLLRRYEKESDSRAKFTVDEVREIRRLYENGLTQKELRKKYDCGIKVMLRVLHHEVPYDFK